jgi:hypothetical protein
MVSSTICSTVEALRHRVKSAAFKHHTLRIDGGAKQSFQCLDVSGKGLSASFGQTIEGLWLAQYELPLDNYVPGFFELEQLRAPVAVGDRCAGAKRIWPVFPRG